MGAFAWEVWVPEAYEDDIALLRRVGGHDSITATVLAAVRESANRQRAIDRQAVADDPTPSEWHC